MSVPSIPARRTGSGRRPGLVACACGVLAWWFVAAAGARAADPRPVSTREISLLLRSGCTDAEVLRDTAGRPLLEPLDASAEKLLRDAGGGTALIEKLRADRPLATAAQTEAERSRQDAVARQRESDWETNQERRLAASREALDASVATRQQEAMQAMARTLGGKLVVYRDQRVQTYDDRRLPEKKQIALYYAKLADPACRKFTPQLVKFYAQYAPAHPEFEIVFVSQDFSSLEMETDLRAVPMPWPALAFPRLAEEKQLTAPGRDATLPRLLVVDGAGHLLLDSYADGQYVGPQHVLDELKHQAEAAPRAVASGH